MATRRVVQLSRHLAEGRPRVETPHEMQVNPLATGPLEGITVLDLSQMVSGPMGTQILGDQGADVIKVEALNGAAERGSSRAKILSPLFAVVNRNKRSVCMDLKQPKGREAFLRLAARADVIVQNFRPGVCDRMGIGYAACREVNPSVIFVSISGFGKEGPYSRNRVYDPVIQSVTGLASIQADASERPRLMRLIVPDKVTALTSSQAITSALLRRSRTGKGCHVELSMLDAVLSFAWAEGFAQETFIDPAVTPNYTYTRDLVFETTDGYITCGAAQDKEWRALCTALRKPEWEDDPRFASAAARSINRDVRVQLMAEEIAKLSSEEALSRLTEHQVPNGPVNHPRTRVISDPQVVANRIVQRVQHPWGVAPLQMPRTAAVFDGEAFELRRHAPLLGEHTREVLTTLAGMSDEEVAKLMEAGVVRETKGVKPERRYVDSRLRSPVSG